MMFFTCDDLLCGDCQCPKISSQLVLNNMKFIDVELLICEPCNNKDTGDQELNLIDKSVTLSLLQRLSLGLRSAESKRKKYNKH